MSAAAATAQMAAMLAEGQVVELMLENPSGKAVTFDLQALCSALEINDPARVAVATSGRRALVTIYPSNPLAVVRAITREDLVMDRRGRITKGLYQNGRKVKLRLFDPDTGSAQRFVLFGTTGAGKSKALQIQLAAEKINGIVTFLADLKEGQSVPEAKDNVDFYGTTPEAAILILRSGVEIAKARMRRYTALGRSAFVLGYDPLLHVHIDEANRLLEKGAPYREEATYLIKEIGRTGRSVGVGIGIAAQAAHLEELGGSDTLRAMLKEGEVTLLRWSSSMMQQLTRDGLLPAGVQLTPIPKKLNPTNDLLSMLDDEDDDDDDSPGTQGMGYALTGGHPTWLMRHLRMGSIAPTLGLDPEILDLYGPEPPNQLEAASHEAAGYAYTVRFDRFAFEALCHQVREEQEQVDQPVRPLETGGGSESTTPPRRAALRLDERVLRVLTDAGGALTAEQVLAEVNGDGGKPVKLGPVRNALGALADREDIEVYRPSRGHYALAR